MAEHTRIEWVDHTFNPWIGCTRISNGRRPSACDNCYAAAMSHRRGWARFELGAPRHRTTQEYWKQPVRWNRKAEAVGRRARVFGPSLGDPFDAEVSDAWRADYLALIESTPWLDWILLTKRPQVAARFLAGRQVPTNLWPGITAENQQMFDLRAPVICSIRATVHVLSAEPLLGSIDAGRLLGRGAHQLGWVIAGGESGPVARPSHPFWFRALRDQCLKTDIPYFFKQWGEWAPEAAESPSQRRRHQWEMPSPQRMAKVGRRAAGAELDGTLHRDSPALMALGA